VTPENYLKDMRRKTKRIFTAEQKILIVMEALPAENSIAELCRKHAIQESTFYKWNKEFIEAGKKTTLGRYFSPSNHRRSLSASGRESQA
jgi:transposase